MRFPLTCRLSVWVLKNGRLRSSANSTRFLQFLSSLKSGWLGANTICRACIATRFSYNIHTTLQSTHEPPQRDAKSLGRRYRGKQASAAAAPARAHDPVPCTRCRRPRATALRRAKRPPLRRRTLAPLRANIIARVPEHPLGAKDGVAHVLHQLLHVVRVVCVIVGWVRHDGHSHPLEL